MYIVSISSCVLLPALINVYENVFTVTLKSSILNVANLNQEQINKIPEDCIKPSACYYNNDDT